MYTVDDYYAASLKPFLHEPLPHAPSLHASASLTEPDKCPGYASDEFLAMFPIIDNQVTDVYVTPANIRILFRFYNRFGGEEALNAYRLRILGASANGYGD